MANIKIFVCCHQPGQHVPGHPLLIPTQVGTALAAERWDGFAHDDEGLNISRKNRAYCELTAQYWAWKNVRTDYFGFFHYRRYLYPQSDIKRPYIVEEEKNLDSLVSKKYTHFSEMIEPYDLVLPKPENMHVTVEKHYASAPFHHLEDLELVKDIIRERHGAYMQAMDTYLSGTEIYFGNIFIMKENIFQNYCQWLFGIIEEFDQRCVHDNYAAQELRVDGYLAERLLGIYASAHRDALKILELPRVHFYPSPAYEKQKLINQLLPPGTKQRALVKKLLTKL